MRFSALGPVLFAAGAFALASGSNSDKVTILLYGDSRGSLSPCGCTQPMSGGIERAASVVRQYQSAGPTTLLVNGALIAGKDRQSELKAETFAEASRSMSAGAVHFTSSEAALGLGEMLAMSQLSEGRLVSSSIRPKPASEIQEISIQPPFAIAGISARAALVASPIEREPQTESAAMSDLVRTASEQSLTAVVLLEGDEDKAAQLARNYPGVRLIVYQSGGDPPLAPRTEGSTVLATSGSKGKFVVRITLAGTHTGYERIELGPQYVSDSAVGRIYRRYLGRVESENLLALEPRFDTARYAGSAACAKCHRREFKIWLRSGHARALGSLQAQFHGADPDCVGCHVVGLNSRYGFRSSFATPQLAGVGCESCHGPSLVHALQPRVHRMSKVKQAPCVKCHTGENSPGFQFDAFWRKIRH